MQSILEQVENNLIKEISFDPSMTEESLPQLWAALTRNTSIKILRLDSFDKSPSLLITQAINLNKNIECVCFKNCDPTPIIKELPPHVFLVEFSGTFSAENLPEIIDALSKKENITTVNIGDLSEISLPLVKGLASLKHLTKITLRTNQDFVLEQIIESFAALNKPPIISFSKNITEENIKKVTTGLKLNLKIQFAGAHLSQKLFLSNLNKDDNNNNNPKRKQSDTSDKETNLKEQPSKQQKNTKGKSTPQLPSSSKKNNQKKKPTDKSKKKKKDLKKENAALTKEIERLKLHQAITEAVNGESIKYLQKEVEFYQEECVKLQEQNYQLTRKFPNHTSASKQTVLPLPAVTQAKQSSNGVVNNSNNNNNQKPASAVPGKTTNPPQTVTNPLTLPTQMAGGITTTGMIIATPNTSIQNSQQMPRSQAFPVNQTPFPQVNSVPLSATQVPTQPFNNAPVPASQMPARPILNVPIPASHQLIPLSSFSIGGASVPPTQPLASSQVPPAPTSNKGSLSPGQIAANNRNTMWANGHLVDVTKFLLTNPGFTGRFQISLDTCRLSHQDFIDKLLEKVIKNSQMFQNQLSISQMEATLTQFGMDIFNSLNQNPSMQLPTSRK